MRFSWYILIGTDASYDKMGIRIVISDPKNPRKSYFSKINKFRKMCRHTTIVPVGKRELININTTVTEKDTPKNFSNFGKNSKFILDLEKLVAFVSLQSLQKTYEHGNRAI